MFEELLTRIALALDRESVPYMVIGGQAVLLYGEPRLTRDIDVTVGLDLGGLPQLLRILLGAGLESLVQSEEFTRRTMVLPCQDRSSGTRVDFILSSSVYERAALARAHGVVIRGTTVRFASAEDLVVHKIIAGRPRDLEDVRSVLIKNQNIDRRFIRQELAEFEKALSEPYTKRFEEVCRSADAGA